MLDPLRRMLNPRRWIQQAGLPDFVVAIVGLGLNIWALVQSEFAALAILIIVELAALSTTNYLRLRTVRKRLKRYRRAVRTLVLGMERHTGWVFAKRISEYVVRRNGDTFTQHDITVEVLDDAQQGLHFIELSAGGSRVLSEHEQNGIIFDVRDHFGDSLAFDVQWDVKTYAKDSYTIAKIVIVFDNPLGPTEKARVKVGYNWPRLNPEPGKGDVCTFTYDGKATTRSWECRLTLDKRLVRKAVPRKLRQRAWDVTFTGPLGLTINQEQPAGRGDRTLTWKVVNLSAPDKYEVKFKPPK